MSSSSDERYQRGTKLMDQMGDQAGQEIIQGLERIAPGFGHFLVATAFGDVYSRPGLDLKLRELISIAALTVTQSAQLKIHLELALNVGCKPKEIVETIIQMTLYGGFPAALFGLTAARDLFTKRGMSDAEIIA